MLKFCASKLNRFRDILSMKCSADKRTDQSIFIIALHLFSDCLGRDFRLDKSELL